MVGGWGRGLHVGMQALEWDRMRVLEYNNGFQAGRQDRGVHGI